MAAFELQPGDSRNSLMFTMCRRLVGKWDSIQVELHGRYSPERMLALQLFQDANSSTQAMLSVVLMPIPCLLAVILLEVIPLEAPEKGIQHSQMFWLRGFLSECMFTYLILMQCHFCIPQLPMTSKQIAAVSLLNAIGSIAWVFGLACWIGFPVPFLTTLSAPCTVIIMMVALNAVWGKHFRETPALKKEVRSYGLTLATQLAFTYAYPVYIYGFNSLSGSAQAAYALLLPAIEIVIKNWMSYLIRDKHDSKPEFIVFHIEVFHALYLACCLQNSTSHSSLAVFIGVDFCLACLSLHDVRLALDAVHKIVEKEAQSQLGPAAEMIDAHASDSEWPSIKSTNSRARAWRRLPYLEAAIFLLKHDQKLLQSLSLNRPSTHNELPQIDRPVPSTNLKQQNEKKTRGLHGSKPQQAATSTVCSETVFAQTNHLQSIQDHDKMHQHQVSHPTRRVIPLNAPNAALNHQLSANLAEKHKHLLLSMSGASRLRFVQQVLHVLYMTEFLLLVEFVEVVVPVVYSTYLGLAFCLPNRAFYTQLRDIDAEELLGKIGNILVYGVLEACSRFFERDAAS